MLNKIRRLFANDPEVVSPKIDDDEGSTATKAVTRVERYKARRERHEIQRRRRARENLKADCAALESEIEEYRSHEDWATSSIWIARSSPSVARRCY